MANISADRLQVRVSGHHERPGGQRGRSQDEEEHRGQQVGLQEVGRSSEGNSERSAAVFRALVFFNRACSIGQFISGINVESKSSSSAIF